MTKISKITDNDHGDAQNGDGVEQRLLDLLLQRLRFFLVRGDFVEQGLERTGLFAGLHEIDEKVVEIQGEFRERFMQRAAALDARFDVEHQLLHRWLFVTVADDLECLHHRDAGGHHGGELTAEHGDIFVGDLAAGPKRIALRFYARGGNALTPQIGAQRGFIGGKGLAANLVSALVLAFPKILGFFFASGCRYRPYIYPCVSYLFDSHVVDFFQTGKAILHLLQSRAAKIPNRRPWLPGRRC